MSVKATIKATLEISVDSRWGDDCTVGQVRKQALDGANLILSKALGKDPNRIKMMGKTEVLSIHYTED